MNPIRIGLIGAARISKSAIIVPAGTNPDFEIVALASCDRSRAISFAKECNIPVVAESYQHLLARDDIDLVYNALPPVHHARWCVEALNAGKAVLCEKPFSMTTSEARQMVAAAESSGRPLLEAFHYRHHPCVKRVVEIVTSSEFGPITLIDAVFEVPIAYNASELRWRAELGGGALLDLGCYCLHILRAIAGPNPKVLSAHSQMAYGVDETTVAVLLFPNGISAKIRASMSSPSFRAELIITGENGSVKLTNFVAPHLGGRLHISRGNVETTEDSNAVTTYAYQLAHVADVMLRGQPPLITGEDSIGNMACIESIRRMAE